MTTETSFYVTGGTLRHDTPCYVERRADQQLFAGLTAGEFCYVLTSRQMGKSSLMNRTAARLRQTGFSPVWTTGIDTACCTSNDGNSLATNYCVARFRHSGGANHALADGHAKWYRGPDRWDAQSFSGVVYRHALAPNASA